MAIPHPRYHAVAYGTSMESLKAKLASMEANTTTAGFRDRVSKAWGAVRAAGATILPAKVRSKNTLDLKVLVALYLCQTRDGVDEIPSMYRLAAQATSGRLVFSEKNCRYRFGTVNI